MSLGSAAYGSSRLNVCVVFPNRIGCPNVGWSYALDTTRLADGLHRLIVTAHSLGGEYGTVQSSFTVSNAGVNNSLHAYIDFPRPSDTLSGTPTLGGWALNDEGSIGSIVVSVDGVPDGLTGDYKFRPDVCAVYPGRANCPFVGWEYVLNTLKFADGRHTLDITLANGWGHAAFSSSFNVDNSFATNPTLLYIDQPNPSSGPLSGLMTVAGWALDDRVLLSNSLAISLDGFQLSNLMQYNLLRPDVCAAYPGRVGCANVGWSALLDTTSIADGPHTLTVTARGTKTQTASMQINVANGKTILPSFRIYIDQPYAGGPPLRGTAVVSGWAFATKGYQPSVFIYMDDDSFGLPVIPNSRPDVCSVYPAALGRPYVGWSLRLDTTQLPDGPHTLKAVANSGSFGAGVVSVPITIGNFVSPDPMHLVIETSGGTLSGVANLRGWAVSDDAATITIAVSIDGALLGNASYSDSPQRCLRGLSEPLRVSERGLALAHRHHGIVEWQPYRVGHRNLRLR